MLLIVDCGSQTTHLIGRRLRELGADVTIILPHDALATAQEKKPEGIVISGGPASVYEENAPTLPKALFELGIPALGICYGEQLLSHVLNGNVKPGKTKEFGPARLRITNLPASHESRIMEGLPEEFQVWMNHGDEVVTPPPDFKTLATTATIPHAVIAHEEKAIYGIQFHPEVVHTQFGEQIFSNFLKICGIPLKKRIIDKELVDNINADIRDSVENKKAICARAGGVDSSVAALLVHEAIGEQLTSVYIDSGLMRENETTLLTETFEKHYKMKVLVVHAQNKFLKALQGVTDPEEKRMIIGKTFIEVLEEEAKKIGATFLIQGTIYPDVIESKGTEHAEKIKSHHNVGGLPEHMKLVLLEPLRQFYKDEVRAIGTVLKLPDEIVRRQPFPGPGLAIRIIGAVTEEKLSILRRADNIVREEVKHLKLWQAFAVFTGVKTTGVRGDARFYGETIAVRLIEATDAMSANFARVSYDILDKISVRIINEVPEVNRVVYDITNKPPATMEWE